STLFMPTAFSDNASRNINVKGGIIDSRRKDGPHEDLPRLGTERWHGDPRPCPNPKIPRLYESWHGAASGVNPPGGIWFGGPPGAPYGAPIAPGGFPMEFFPYYRPPVSEPGLPNSQAVPPPGAGHHGHQPKNEDLFRPHNGDSYIRPAIPFRPGFFPGPYGPPVGFCNPICRRRRINCYLVLNLPQVMLIFRILWHFIGHKADMSRF
ncbi:hypothetical protein Ancab_024063, partial [Ancistrocladus abbreviatus]